MNRVSEIHHIWSEDNFCQPVIAICMGWCYAFGIQELLHSYAIMATAR